MTGHNLFGPPINRKMADHNFFLLRALVQYYINGKWVPISFRTSQNDCMNHLPKVIVLYTLPPRIGNCQCFNFCHIYVIISIYDVYKLTLQYYLQN